MAKQTNPVEEAKKVIEQEKKERGEKAKAAFDKLCKDFNIELVPTVNIGGQLVPVNQILALPVGVHIMLK